MTEDRPPLAELLAKAGDGDVLRSVAEAVVQLLMQTDVEGLIGAGRHERSGERTTYRTAIATARSIPGSALSSWLIRVAAQPPSCARVRISRPSSSRGRPPRRHSSP
jgi:hypothetical protein